MIQASPWPVEQMRIRDLKERYLKDFDLHLLGNLEQATAEQCRALAAHERSVLFEHDYRMCRWRGNIHAAFGPYHRRLWRCNCPARKWRGVFDSALGAIFLTQRQLNTYRSNPFLRLPRNAVLGCSVMSPSFFDAVTRYQALGAPRGKGTCILYSRNPTKGFKEALEYCKEHAIDPKIIRDATPAQVLDAFSDAERLVFLPQWPEPASRIALEARFLGCEIVSNEALGVAGESWWHAPDELAIDFVREAPRRFWALVHSFMTGTTHATWAWKRPSGDARTLTKPAAI